MINFHSSIPEPKAEIPSKRNRTAQAVSLRDEVAEGPRPRRPKRPPQAGRRRREEHAERAQSPLFVREQAALHTEERHPVLQVQVQQGLRENDGPLQETVLCESEDTEARGREGLRGERVRRAGGHGRDQQGVPVKVACGMCDV